MSKDSKKEITEGLISLSLRRTEKNFVKKLTHHKINGKHMLKTIISLRLGTLFDLP